MASPILITGVALTAAYLATRSKQPTTTVRDHRPEPKTGASQVTGSVDAAAAAANPGTYIGPTGAQIDSDGMPGPVLGTIVNGTTSSTPSGDTTGGDTSTTPSSEGVSVSGMGTQKNLDGESSPSGPNPVGPSPKPVEIPAEWIKFGNVDGLTVKQRSQALSQEGPALGLVW